MMFTPMPIMHKPIVPTFLPMMLPMPPINYGRPPQDIPQVPHALDLCMKKPDEISVELQNARPIKMPENKMSAISPRTSEFSDVSNSSIDSNSNNIKIGKTVRPFKAYPNDIFAVPMVESAIEAFNSTSEEAYLEYRKKILPLIQREQKTNNNMRRMQSTREVNDPTYLEKRKKNNEAAKRSRDARRAKEDEIAIRCKFLEDVNRTLRAKLLAAEAERQRLYKIIYHQ